MLTIKKISGSESAAAYYAEYAQGKGEAQGSWLDHSGNLVSSGSNVEPEAMLNMLRGISPDGTTQLCQNPGEGHQPGWDLTFSPPKSVSIAWSNAEPALRQRIEDVHKASVLSALQFINDEATKVRMGKGGAIVTEARLVAALFQHSSNRAEEPQLHTHAIVFNVAQSVKDEKWRTLHPYPIYRAYMAAGALYKADLAHQMRSLGFDTVRTKDSFELSAIPTHVCEAQSSRSKAIEEALSQRGLDRSTASAVTKELLALSSREEKGTERVIRDFERWQKENSDHGFGPDELKQVLADNQHEEPPVAFAGKSQDDLIRERMSQLTTQASTFNIYDVYRSMAESAIGETDAAEAVRLVQVARSGSEIVSLGPNKRDEARYSTQEMAKIEQDNMLAVAARRGEDLHKVPDVVVQSVLRERPTMNREQVDAFVHLVAGHDGVAFIEGDAGTGKSFMMASVREAYESSGYEVRGISFTNKAAKNLEDGSGIKNCQSVDALLYQQRKGENPLHKKTILILDEAGMLDSRKMQSILSYCREAGTKLVCIGDQKQIQPIAAGQAFGSMKRHFGAKRLTEVMRQKDEWLQTAINDFAEGRTKAGIDGIERHDCLKIVNDRKDARDSVIKEWSERVAQVGLDKAPLMVVTTNAEVDILNSMAREKLVSKGLIDQGPLIQTDHGRNSFSRGDRIVFTSNFKKKGIYNSAVATVEKLKIPLNTGKNATLTVKTEAGRRIRFGLETFKGFRHAYALTAHKSQGSTVDQVMVLIDGPLMDREKFYVAVSRGREKPRVFADRQTLGDLPFEERKRLATLSPEDRQREEHEFFKASLGRMLGVSHEKDTSQDYPLSHAALSLPIDQRKQAASASLSRWEEVKTKVADHLRLIHERIAAVFRDVPSQAIPDKPRPEMAGGARQNGAQSKDLKDQSYER